MSEAIELKLKDVSKSFSRVDSTEVTNAVTDVNISMFNGEFVSLVGTSGCGKSTILRMIAGLIAPTTGEITINGDKITAPGPDIGMVFQKPTLFPWLTVEDNVAFSLKMQGKLKEGMEDVHRLINVIGLEKFKKDYPGQLSGGMAQRVALARAMISKPKILLMDEPLGALDAFTRMNMQNEILDMWQVNKQLVVMVTHDIDEAIHMSSRILVMEAHPGRIREEIKIDMDYPRNRSSSSFVEYRNHILDLLHFA
ncbi:MAG: ABC transporter ATP-binding protein [Lachnospiraceae bacterium]|nr:ABC transporter ATP-binding protein [Lachnospiraceae bacterium]